LNEEEETLAQAQEKTCGIVVYTGMNNDGDFYIGNKKINSATGKEKTFDIPIPTVTGEDSSANSVVFDEIIVKERLIVEGGNSGTVLSQFDGPVTFNGETKFNENMIVDASAKITGVFNITDTTESTSTGTGALTVDGGVGIDKNLYVGGDLTANNNLYVAGVSTFVGVSTFQGDLYSGSILRVFDTTQNNLGIVTSGSFQVLGGAGIGKNLTVGGATTISGNVHIKGNITVEGTGLFPIGSIIIWYGSVAAIPEGWSLCNGQTVDSVTTPDLRERFVVGAGGDNSTVSGSGYSVGDVGGSPDAVVVEHNHSITQTDHSHSYSRSRDGNNFGGDGQDVHQNYSTQPTGGAQANITIDNAGVSGINANLPPYYALCYIMRTS
jgi:microcystin-dependent protein